MDPSRDRLFFDGVRQIHFLGGMIRFDCGEYVLVPKPDAEPGAPATELSLCKTKTISMPPQGFLSMLKSMEDLAAKLAEAGIFSKKDVAEATGKTETPVASTAVTEQQETK